MPANFRGSPSRGCRPRGRSFLENGGAFPPSAKPAGEAEACGACPRAQRLPKPEPRRFSAWLQEEIRTPPFFRTPLPSSRPPHLAFPASSLGGGGALGEPSRERWKKSGVGWEDWQGTEGGHRAGVGTRALVGIGVSLPALLLLREPPPPPSPTCLGVRAGKVSPLPWVLR